MGKFGGGKRGRFLAVTVPEKHSTYSESVPAINIKNLAEDAKNAADQLDEFP